MKMNKVKYSIAKAASCISFCCNNSTLFLFGKNYMECEIGMDIALNTPEIESICVEESSCNQKILEKLIFIIETFEDLAEIKLVNIKFPLLDPVSAAISKSTSVSAVTLSGNRGEWNPYFLEMMLEQNSRLIKLEVVQNITVRVLPILEQVPNKLQFLNLTKNNISSEEISKFAPILAKNTHLTHLILKDNEISSSGANSLSVALQENSTLTHLDLRNNQIRDVGASSFGECLAKNYTLQYLYLSGNQMEDDGVYGLSIGLSQNSSLLNIIHIK